MTEQRLAAQGAGAFLIRHKSSTADELVLSHMPTPRSFRHYAIKLTRDPQWIYRPDAPYLKFGEHWSVRSYVLLVFGQLVGRAMQNAVTAAANVACGPFDGFCPAHTTHRYSNLATWIGAQRAALKVAVPHDFPDLPPRLATVSRGSRSSRPATAAAPVTAAAMKSGRVR